MPSKVTLDARPCVSGLVTESLGAGGQPQPASSTVAPSSRIRWIRSGIRVPASIQVTRLSKRGSVWTALRRRVFRSSSHSIVMDWILVGGA